jgi:hypothetical protein
MLAHAKSSAQKGQLLAVQPRGLNIYPLIDEETPFYMTGREYERMRRKGSVSIDHAYSFIPAPDAPYPFRELIAPLYDLKQRSAKDSMQRLVAKRVMNSLYGKCAEITGSVGGKLFSPAYAAECTSYTRCQLAEAVEGKERSICSLLTDSVITDTPLDLSGAGLGSWDVQHAGEELILLQTGVYQYRGRKARTRGFSRNTDLFKACKKAKKTSIRVLFERPVHHKEAIVQKHFQDVGVFKTFKKEIDTTVDRKRLWGDDLTPRMLAEQSYDSCPVPVSILSL